jgi:hypothetical protein
MKPIKNISSTFEKMLLKWEWNHHKKAKKIAVRVMYHLQHGGQPPKGYSIDAAYELAEQVLFWKQAPVNDLKNLSVRKKA